MQYKARSQTKMIGVVLTSIIFLVLFSSFTSALITKDFQIDRERATPQTQYGTITLRDKLWIDIFGWFEKDVKEITLKENSESCYEDCYAIKEITLYEKGKLVEDVYFETIKEDGSRIKQDIRSYQFYIQDGVNEIEVDDYEWVCEETGKITINGTAERICSNIKTGSHIVKEPIWERYNYEELEKGDYVLKLEGQKKPSRTIDWIIKSNGKWLDEWAIWGNKEELKDNLISYWTFNNTLIDTFGKRNWSNGGSVILNTTAMSGQSYSLTGSVTSANILSTTRFLQSQFGTFGFWFKTKAGGNLMGRGATGVSTDFILQTDAGGQIGFSYIDDNLVNVYASGDVRDDKWHYLTLIGNASGTAIYVDGQYKTKTALITLGRQTNDFLFGSYHTSSQSVDYIIDEIGLWDVALSPSLIEDLYRAGTGIFYPFLGNNIYLNFPINNTYSSTNNIQFNSSNSMFDATLVNTTLWINSLPIETKETTGITNESIWTQTLSDGNYNWTIQVCDSDDDCGWADEGNRTLTIDTIEPLIEINLGNGTFDYGALDINHTINYTITDVNLQSCWLTYNHTNLTLPCTSGEQNTSNFKLEYGIYNATLYANDTAGNLNSSFFNWTYLFFEEKFNYSTISYETKQETFLINGSFLVKPVSSISIVYDGKDYPISSSCTFGNCEITKNLDIPELSTSGVLENRSFYWKMNFETPTTSLDTITRNQTIRPTIYQLCNTTLKDIFFNVSFRDEQTDLKINGSIDSSSFVYWLGSGSETKTYNFVNKTQNYEYNFCLYPPHETMKDTRLIQFSLTGYPQRKYQDSGTLTNSTTHKILYLLGSSDGIYSTIQVIDQRGDVISGVTVTVERQFSNVWTVVGKEVTDSAGAVTFWINPDYDHRFTFEKSECTTSTETVRPTQTTYTSTMSCAASSEEPYVSNIDGIKFFKLPPSGLLTNGMQNFSYKIVSSKSNIAGIKFELVNMTNGILASVSSTCTPSGCIISTLYNVSSSEKIKGKYFVDIGSGYILLEADAHWINVDISDEEGTMKKFWLNFRKIFDDWHEEGEDVTNTTDFSRIVFIFLILAILISLFSKFTGFDVVNPGAFLIFLFIIVFLGSIAGFPDQKGFFYLDNLDISYHVNNYLLAGYMLLITITHFIGVKLQSQR